MRIKATWTNFSGGEKERGKNTPCFGCISSHSHLRGPMWDLHSKKYIPDGTELYFLKRESGGVDLNRVGFVKSS